MAKSPLRRLLTRTAIVTALFVVASVGFLVYAKLWPQHQVMISNDNEFAVDVEACGKSVTVQPHTTQTVKAHDGICVVSAKGASGFAETGSIVFPDNYYTLQPRTAVYNVDGKSSLAIVTVEYGTAGGSAPPVVPVGREHHLELLASRYGDIDEPFPAEVSSKKMGERIAHICHVDFDKETVGCPGL